MGPDDEKRIRQLLVQKRKLPEPAWNLFARATKRFSQLAERQPSIEAQAKQGAKEQEQIASAQMKQDTLLRKAAEKEQKAAEKEQEKKLKQQVKETKSFKADIEKQNVRLSKLKKVPDILRQANLIRIMNENLEKRL